MEKQWNFGRPRNWGKRTATAADYSGRSSRRSASPIGSQISARPVWARRYTRFSAMTASRSDRSLAIAGALVMRGHH
jgi:hypothetical protein